MELELIRSVFNPQSTLGELHINGSFFAYTLEDVDRKLNGDCAKKVKNETAIDYGQFEIVLSFSNRFQKYLPELLNVPCFSKIRIHGGNTQDDTEGCILIGAETNHKDRIWNCPSTVNKLVTLLKSVEKKEKIWIEVAKKD